MGKEVLTLLKVAILLLVLSTGIIPPNSSYSYIRDADLMHSRSSVRVGWTGDLVACAETMIDRKSSFGFFYMPYVSGLNFETVELTYNIQMSTEEAMCSSFYAGIYSSRSLYADPDKKNAIEYWRTYYFPEVGFAFKFRIDEKWDFRMEILYFIPTKLEFDYSINENMELTLGISQTGLIGFNYIF